MSEAEMFCNALFGLFHVKRSGIPSYVGAVHDFQTSAAFEGDESAGELLCRIMVEWLDYPTEILSVELTDLVDVFDPNSYMLDFHKIHHD